MSVIFDNKRSFSYQEPPFNNTILTSNIINVILKIERNEELKPGDILAIKDAQKLLAKIIEGSRLVENKMVSNMTYSIDEGISTFDYALMTIESLKILDSKLQMLTEFFQTISQDLENLINKKYNTDKIKFLKEFFLELSNSFKTEIMNKYLKTPTKLKQI